MNWVGGAENPEAAQTILGMGGIPTTAIVQGGEIVSFKLEHVWTEAWVDFMPSRGVVERSGDSWIPMDASFKQYIYTNGIHIDDQFVIDSQSFEATVLDKAILNESEGWVQNLLYKEIDAEVDKLRTQINEYMEGKSNDYYYLVGRQDIRVIPPQPLSSGLPYKKVSQSVPFASVPANLQHKFKYIISLKVGSFNDAPIIEYEAPTASLAGKSIALSFSPATEQDKEIVLSHLPKPEEDGSIDQTKLPDTLPGYLVNLKANLNINKEVVSSGLASTLGSELNETMALWSPSNGWKSSTNYPASGAYRAIGLNLQGISPNQSEKLKNALAVTAVKLDSENVVQLATLSEHELVGDLLQGTLVNYFAMNDIQDKVDAQRLGVLSYRSPSYGVMTTQLQTHYWFGLPRNVSIAGLTMDIDNMAAQRVSKNNDQSVSIAFSEVVGQRMSVLENLIPEQVFSSEYGRAEGISAVKALSIAIQEGQKVWTIDSRNLNLAISRISVSQEAKQDITNAVNQGLIVTIHERQIKFNDWIGEGYILKNPNTGEAAYIISGGSNGGFWGIHNEGWMFIGFVAGLIGAYWIPALIVSIVIALRLLYIDFVTYSNIEHLCDNLKYFLWASALVTALFFFIPPLYAVVGLYITLLTSQAALNVANTSVCRD
ncbi:TPA: hypothetical protein ACX6RO_001673 [Photobacterium damselae]